MRSRACAWPGQARRSDEPISDGRPPPLAFAQATQASAFAEPPRIFGSDDRSCHRDVCPERAMLRLPEPWRWRQMRSRFGSPDSNRGARATRRRSASRPYAAISSVCRRACMCCLRWWCRALRVAGSSTAVTSRSHAVTASQRRCLSGSVGRWRHVRAPRVGPPVCGRPRGLPGLRDPSLTRAATRRPGDAVAFQHICAQLIDQRMRAYCAAADLTLSPARADPLSRAQCRPSRIGPTVLRLWAWPAFGRRRRSSYTRS